MWDDEGVVVRPEPFQGRTLGHRIDFKGLVNHLDAVRQVLPSEFDRWHWLKHKVIVMCSESGCGMWHRQAHLRQHGLQARVGPEVVGARWGLCTETATDYVS
jgi:hypothetical protein